MDDERLAQLFRRYRDSHDTDALGKVFDRLAPGLLKVAAHLTRDRALAEDLLQTTFLTAMEKTSAFDDERPLRPWLAGILLKHARHQMRKSARSLEKERLKPSHGRDPMQIAEDRELEHEVERALRSLPERYQEVLVPRLKDGLKGREIARSTGRSPGVVRMQIHRGLALLRQALPQSLLTALLGYFWSRRTIASVRAHVFTKASAPAAAPAVPMLLAGGMVMAKKVMLITAGATLLVAASLWILWNDDPRDVDPKTHPVASRIEETTESGPTAVDDVTPHSNRDTVPVLPQTAAAEPPESMDEHPSSGRVLDIQGRPIPAARVIFGESGNLAVESDASGHFTFSSEYSDKDLSVAPPYVLVRSGRDAKGEDLLLIAAPRVDVHGIVTDEEDRPLPETRAVVKTFRLVDFPEILDRTVDAFRYRPTLSDGDGRIGLFGLPVGCSMLSLEKNGYEVCTIPVNREIAGPQRFILRSLKSEKLVVTGRIVDHAFRVVPEAMVGLGELQTRSDDLGAFRFEFRKEVIPKGGATVYAAKPGYRTKVITGFGSDLTEVKDQIEMEIRLEGPTLEIAGTLLDAEGAPLEGSIVLLWKEEYLTGQRTAEDLAVIEEPMGRGTTPSRNVPPGTRAFSITDEGGSFLLGGLDDREYRLRIVDHQAGFAMTTRPIPAGSRNVVIRIPAHAFREKLIGRVVDRRGDPVPTAEVWTSMQWVNNSNNNSWTCIGGTRCDDYGRFELPRVCRLDTLLLAVSGPDICTLHQRIEPSSPDTDIMLTVELLCYFRIELSDPSSASAFRLLDEKGERLEVSERGGIQTFKNTPFPLHNGKTEILSSSDRACTIHLLGEGERRMPVRLTPGEVNVLRF